MGMRKKELLVRIEALETAFEELRDELREERVTRVSLISTPMERMEMAAEKRIFEDEFKPS